MAEITDTGYAVSAATTTANAVTPATIKTTVASDSHDRGACCYAPGALAAAANGAARATLANKGTCPAAFDNATGSGLGKVGAAASAGDAADRTFIKSTVTNGKWWCSDGAIAADSTTTPT